MVKWNLFFFTALGRRDFWGGSQHGRDLDGCGLITSVLVALTIKACAEYCMNIMLNDDRKCQIPHVWCTDGPQWPQLCIQCAQRPLVPHICRRFEAFQKHKTCFTHGKKLILSLQEPVRKKLFRIGPLLSVNTSQMYTFLTCHHSSFSERRGEVCGGTQTLGSPTISVTRRTIPQRDQWTKLPWRQTLGGAELCHCRRSALRLDLIQPSNKEQTGNCIGILQTEISPRICPKSNRVFRKVCQYNWI